MSACAGTERTEKFSDGFDDTAYGTTHGGVQIASLLVLTRGRGEIVWVASWDAR
jgi:hypothetical protein